MTVTLGLHPVSDTGTSSTDLVTGTGKLYFRVGFSDGLIAGQLVYLEFFDNDSTWKRFELGDAFGGHAVEAAEIANNHIDFGTAIDPFEDGTWLFRMHRTDADGSNQSPYSAVLTVTISTVTPILGEMLRLFAPTTTVSLQVPTDQDNGALYWVITASAQPTITTAQIVAGQTQTGGVPLQSGSIAVTTAGNITFGDNGLTPDTILYCYATHRNALEQDSNIASVSWLQSQVGWSPAGAAGNLRLLLDVDETASMTIVNSGGTNYVTAMADLGPDGNDVVANPFSNPAHTSHPVLTTLGGLAAISFPDTGGVFSSLQNDAFPFRSKNATFLWIGQADASSNGRLMSIRDLDTPSGNGDMEDASFYFGWSAPATDPATFYFGHSYPTALTLTGSVPNPGGMNAVLVCFNGTIGELYYASSGAFVSQGTTPCTIFIGSETMNKFNLMMGGVDQATPTMGFVRLVMLTSSNEKPDLNAIYDYCKAHTPSIP